MHSMHRFIDLNTTRQGSHLPQDFRVHSMHHLGDLKQSLWVYAKIRLHFWASSPSGKARGARMVHYLSDEQRRHTGWIGDQKREVFLKRAVSLCIAPLPRYFDGSLVLAPPLDNLDIPWRRV